MNTLAKVFLVSAVISLPVFSGNAHSHANADSKGGMMGGMMMEPQQMMNMHERMQQSHSLMEQIKSEEDADKRSKLMQQHMEGMHEQMQMMDKMMDHKSKDDMSSNAKPGQMQMMNMRMDMMQMMMKQMMEHQDQDQKLEKHHDD